LIASAAAAAPDAELTALLSQGAAQLGLPLIPAQADRLIAYLRLIERWNGAYNLTAVRDPRAMVVQHLLDCLAVVEPLRRRLGAPDHARLLDVGSGAGLPGVVIAAMEPRLRVVCVDSVGKKAAFLTHAAATLGLKNLTALHRRVEDLPPGERFDVITSRAFASLADFLTATRPLLGIGGTWMAMKGKTPSEELAGLEEIEFHVEPLTVPELNAERCLVWITTKYKSEHMLSTKTMLDKR
jgi:16S rRNA (guanine527-N7)-methyltransferase